MSCAWDWSRWHETRGGTVSSRAPSHLGLGPTFDHPAHPSRLSLIRKFPRRFGLVEALAPV